MGVLFNFPAKFPGSRPLATGVTVLATVFRNSSESAGGEVSSDELLLGWVVATFTGKIRPVKGSLTAGAAACSASGCLA